jgi:phosphatidylserine/phosphatidylglycerophosphate/cardiolipin synthase-like enzyme
MGEDCHETEIYETNSSAFSVNCFLAFTSPLYLTGNSNSASVVGILFPQRRLYRGNRQGNQQRQKHNPGSILLIHFRPNSESPGGSAQGGVKVEAILDKSNRTDKYSSADFLLHAGIPTFIDAAHAIAHNKIMIIDGETVITGSFNFTKAAEEKNAENLLIIKDKDLAGRYIENWKNHAGHSEVYKGRVGR